MTEIPAAAARRICNARAMIFDMDGTLVLGDAASGGHKALPGAIELLARLRSRGIPFRVFTNGTAKTPAVYAAGLRHAGLDITDGEMMTRRASPCRGGALLRPADASCRRLHARSPRGQPLAQHAEFRKRSCTTQIWDALSQ